MPNISATSKPSLKCVDFQHIQDWLPLEHKQKINIVQAWKIISREFCGAVVTRGVCPIDCNACKAEIVDLFRLENAVKPAALLTWLAKDHSARWIEKLIVAEKVSEQFPRNSRSGMETPQQAYDSLFPAQESYGTEGFGNPFLELLKDYE